MKKHRLRLAILVNFCLYLLLLTACQHDGGQLIGNNRSWQEEVNTSLIYSVAFADGYGEATLPFELAYQNAGDILSENNVIALLKSKDDLLSLCQDNHFPFFITNDENFDRKLSRTVRSYNESYFEDKDLIFILLNETGNTLAKIDKIENKQGNLTIYIANPIEDQKMDVSDMGSTLVYLIETEKQPLENISTITIEKIQKGAPDEYGSGNAYSDFYSLGYAYNRGLISQNEIRSIGYYYNSGKEWRGEDISESTKEWKDFVETNYQPLEKSPKELSEETIDKIKNSYVDLINCSLKYYYEQQGMTIKKDLVTEKTIDEVKYLGSYNGYIAVAIKSSGMSVQQVTTPIIAGITFYYANSGETILLFHEAE
jgi:hypothetical protein